jgi:predicted RecA/RadA family phage recombinase
MAKAVPVDTGASGTFVAPGGGVVERTPVLIGNALVIPAVTAAAGVTFEGYISGTWEIDKLTTDPIVAGDLVSWEVGNTRVRRSLTYTEVTGDLNGMGIAVAAAGNGTTRVKVLINRGPGNVV